MSGLQEKIKEWLKLDNELLEFKEKMKQIKKEKDEIEGMVLDIVKKQKLDSSIIKLNDGNITFVNNKTIGGISLKIIQQSLEKFIDDEELIKNIINDVKDARSVTHSFDIKRKINQ